MLTTKLGRRNISGSLAMWNLGLITKGRRKHAKGAFLNVSRLFFDVCSIVSYINNVHPHVHRGLYSATERLIASMLPLFEASLSALKTERLLAPRILPRSRKGDYFPNRQPGPYRAPELRADDKYLNENSEFSSSIFVDLRKEFWDVGIQLIIKLSSIELNSERPEYPGEEWHVQGQLVRPKNTIWSSENASDALLWQERADMCQYIIFLWIEEYPRSICIIPTKSL